ncbi:MAG: endolytic transglycosylase MltG [Erysipelotrichaceae bacterium]
MKTKKLGIIALIIFLVVLAASTFAYFTLSNNLKAISSTSEEVNFVVEQGTLFEDVCKQLEEKKLIKNDTTAYYYGRLKKLTDVKQGLFKLNRNMDVEKILTDLNDESKALSTDIRITIKEGYWAKDIAKVISENTNVTSEELINLWNDDTFIDELKAKYWFISDDVKNSEFKVKLEGFLYPDTYDFYVVTNAKDVTYKLLDRFDELVTPYKDRMLSSELGVFKTIVLASMVQFESGNYSDMPKVAGVFMNRLNSGMKMGSSVTVCYALYDYKSWEECESNPDIDSKYNTYKYEGLPIGPILNPSIKAIEASINFTKHDYFYFMADVNGDGTTYFAKTFKEHQANVDKYLR